MLSIALLNSKYLLSLSNDILDMAQIKMGVFVLNKEKFNLRELITEVLEMF